MTKPETYYTQARQRAKRRKSPWNLILIPFAIFGIAGTAFLLAKGLLAFQQLFIPPDAILAHWTRIGAILMFVPIIFPALAIGMMIANLIAWCIPRARRTFEKEARGVKGASFKEAMKPLTIASVILLFAVAPICLLGALNYFYVTAAGAHVNPLLSITERRYGWSAIRRIQTRCLAERRNLHLNYILYMEDGTKVDLLNEPRLKFVRVYNQIKPFLKAQGGIIYQAEIGEKDIARLRSRYHPQDAERILEILRERQ
jgi:hypothetical protein